MIKMILRPPILLLIAFILPDKDSTICLHIDKPSPLIFLLLSVVYNGSNIFSKSSVPIPLSAISNLILSFFSLFMLIFMIFLFLFRYLILLVIVFEKILLNLIMSTSIREFGQLVLIFKSMFLSFKSSL